MTLSTRAVVVVAFLGSFAALARGPVKSGEVLKFLHHANEMEISMGQLAEEKGQSQAIRDYGARLIKDHTDADQKVAQTATKDGVNLSEQPTSDDEAGTMTRLKSLSGLEFDKAFAAHMEAGHKEVIGKLQGEFSGLPRFSATRELVTALLPALQSHRRLATAILAQLETHGPRDHDREPASP